VGVEALPFSQGNGDIPLDLSIMLLEDQMLIAMDVEGMLADHGFTRLSTVNSAADARRLVERGGIAFAVLDVNLGSETSLPIAAELRRRGIPFVFATGYGEGNIIPPEFADVPVVRKPYEANGLLSAISRALAR
jgi:DNA-binding NtrC family response regulator